MTAAPPIIIASLFPNVRFSVPAFDRFVVPENFRIDQSSVSREAMLDSFVSTPSRYLLELVRRTRTSCANAPWILVFNPLLRPPEFLLRLTLAAAQKATRAAVFGSSNGLPVAYLLPPETLSDLRYLLLLSCADADLDQRLLAMILNTAVTSVNLDFPAPLIVPNGFLVGDYLKPMKWCAEHAIGVMARARSSSTDADVAGRSTAGPCFTAYFPHHAGDVLFMALAARDFAKPLYDEIAIHEDYAAIARRAGMALSILPLHGPVPNRGSYRSEDCLHFMDLAPHLPTDRFYVYCRTTRNYNFTDFHFIDHFRFCLGEALTRPEQLSNGIPRHTERPPAPGRRKVLLHCSAGWPLKVYPLTAQIHLTTQLRQLNVGVVTLDATSPADGCTNVRFTDLAALENLLATVDLVIGMDSFPAHFAAYVLGIPTIYLFSSTHPVNSSPRLSGDHRILQGGETCCPCLGWDRCFRYRTSDCRNFAPPAQVAEIVGHMLDLAPHRYALPVLPALPPLPSTKCPSAFSAKNPRPLAIKPGFLEQRRIRIRRPLSRLTITVFSSLALVGEFVLSVRREGVAKALALTAAFLRRRLAGTHDR